MAEEYGTARTVVYNAGDEGTEGDKTYLAIVLKDVGDTKLNLFVLNESGERVLEVPHREPEDYGDEGGGRTWRYAR